MHNIFSSFSTSSKININNSDNSSAIYYNFVGNFIPPEWSNLSSHNGKILSKTARHLLSLIVFRLQIYHNNSIDELQETYHFFQEHLGVCQRRIRQCLLELEKAGFIYLSTTTIIKYGIKCPNTPCVKLAKDFQPYNQKSSTEKEKIFSHTRKIFRPNLKEISGQLEKSFTHSIYIDNNKNISNKSRCSKSTILQNEQDKCSQNTENQLQQQKLETNSQCNSIKPIHNQQQVDNISVSSSTNSIPGSKQINTALQAVMAKISKQYNSTSTASSSNNAEMSRVNQKCWFKRKKLIDFYPLSQEDADLLQMKSNRGFNLDSINALLLKLAGKYSNHHFGHKKVLMDYMAKALFHELSKEDTQANSCSTQSQSRNLNKAQEQYLNEIESSTNTSKQAQLKRKIVGIFDSNIAYELLSSCCFLGVVDHQYQIKLPHNITLSENTQNQILQQVQMIYGNSIKQLNIVPFTELEVQHNNAQDETQNYLSQLSKQLNPDTVWYRVRKF
ncbi:MAG TPA: hypothetical protein LFV92_06815 [Rickettsia endosymbiont of Ceroptres masudai]|nr:hypothetical protein [Rickettsia endosymbiont of Ceroptres masudai]